MENQDANMRILIVSSLYPPNIIGGAELIVKTISHALIDMGHEINIVTLTHRDAKEFLSEPVSDNIRVHAVPLSNIYWPFNGKQKDPSKLSRLLWHSIDSNNMFMSHKVKRILETAQPDLVLTNNLQGFSTSLFPLFKKHNIPVVHVLHDFSLLCPGTTLFKNGEMCGHNENRCAGCKLLSIPKINHSNCVDGVIGVSNTILQVHLDHGLFSNISSRVIYNALQDTITLADSARKIEKDKIFNFGYIGRIEKSKGIETLLIACRKLKELDINFKLYVAGRGEESYLEHLKSKWPLDNIEYLGFTKQLDFYNKIDALVFPSEWLEGLGNVAFEAFSQGIPVIGSNIGGIPETVKHNETGYIYTPGDDEELAKYMISMLSNLDETGRMSENALGKAREYLPENRAREYHEYLSCILGEKSGAVAYA